MAIVYNAKDHINVIFKLRGSVWPSVLPFCVFNILIATIVYFLRRYDIIDLTFDGGLGYQYISVLVSFFVVINVNTTYSRYWEARGALGKALNTSEMLATRAAIYTCMDTSPKAKEWRKLLKLRLVELIKTTMFLVQNERGSLINLMVPGSSAGTVRLDDDNDGLLLLNNNNNNNNNKESCCYAMSEREPFPLHIMLDAVILSNKEYLKEPLTLKQQEDLMTRSGIYMEAWQDMIKFSTTPRPFVTVQMGRTIIFAFLFGLPFVLTHQPDVNLIECLLAVFFVTYGFMGLMLAEIELHDPLGDEANTLETSRYTAVITNDIDYHLGDENDNNFWIQHLHSLALRSDDTDTTDTTPSKNHHQQYHPNYGSTTTTTTEKQQETAIIGGVGGGGIMERQAHAEAMQIYGSRRNRVLEET